MTRAFLLKKVKFYSYLDGLLLGVLELVLLATERSSEPLATELTGLTLHRHVSVHVYLQVGLLSERFATQSALELFTCVTTVSVHVLPHVTAVCELFPACGA